VAVVGEAEAGSWEAGEEAEAVAVRGRAELAATAGWGSAAAGVVAVAANRERVGQRRMVAAGGAGYAASLSCTVMQAPCQT